MIPIQLLQHFRNVSTPMSISAPRPHQHRLYLNINVMQCPNRLHIGINCISAPPAPREHPHHIYSCITTRSITPANLHYLHTTSPTTHIDITSATKSYPHHQHHVHYRMSITSQPYHIFYATLCTSRSTSPSHHTALHTHRRHHNFNPTSKCTSCTVPRDVYTTTLTSPIYPYNPSAFPPNRHQLHPHRYCRHTTIAYCTYLHHPHNTSVSPAHHKFYIHII